jgi:KDO2-lipid IV(A) lauroyltransferase
MASATKRLMRKLKPTTNAVIGAVTVGLLKAVRLFDVTALSNWSGRTMRHLGPLIPEHRVGRANLGAAFPEKSQAEIDDILRGVWENLGRFGAEFAHIDRIWVRGQPLSGQPRIKASRKTEEIAYRLRDDGKPALTFSAHLANWELAATAAHAMGGNTTVLYRRPNLPAVSDAVIRLRAGSMGTLIPTNMISPFKIAEALERGSHVGMLVDQYHVQGVPVTFFGRKTRANSMLARLARHYECPIHGVRVIRLQGCTFEIELTEELAPVRDAEGKIDVQATTQAITDVVQGWVREHPEQWLWLHRRWRAE